MRALAFLLPLMFVTISGCADDSAAIDEIGDTMISVAEPFTLEFKASGMVLGTGITTTPATPWGCNALNREGLDVNHHTWEIPGEQNGTPLGISSLKVEVQLKSPTLLDADLFLEGPDGTVLGSATAFNVETGPTEGFEVIDGLQPGKYQLVVRGCSGQGNYNVLGQASMFSVVQSVSVEASSNASSAK